MDKEQKQPRINQIIFVDLNYTDEWDIIKRGRPFVITEIKEEEKFFHLYLLAITSQDEKEAEEEKKYFISQYEIRVLPDCLKINPSFVRIHRYIDLKIVKDKLQKSLCKCPNGCFKKYKDPRGNLIDEYDFFVRKHKSYRANKLNISKLLPPIEIEID